MIGTYLHLTFFNSAIIEEVKKVCSRIRFECYFGKTKIKKTFTFQQQLCQLTTDFIKVLLMVLIHLWNGKLLKNIPAWKVKSLGYTTTSVGQVSCCRSGSITSTQLWQSYFIWFLGGYVQFTMTFLTKERRNIFLWFLWPEQYCVILYYITVRFPHETFVYSHFCCVSNTEKNCSVNRKGGFTCFSQL